MTRSLFRIETDRVSLTWGVAREREPTPLEGEDPPPGRLLVRSTLEAHPYKRVAWLPGREDVLRYLVAELRPGDLCLFCGAGDITTWPPDLLAALAER